MTYEEFKAVIERCCREKYYEGHRVEGGSITIEWISGGLTGGNCWGGEAVHMVTPERPIEDRLLDDVLTEVCPNISFLLYKRIIGMAQTRTREDNEYYGNHTEYTVRTHSIRAIHDMLSEAGAI